MPFDVFKVATHAGFENVIDVARDARCHLMHENMSKNRQDASQTMECELAFCTIQPSLYPPAVEAKQNK